METLKRNKDTIRFKMICYIGLGLLTSVVVYTLVNALIDKIMLDLLSPRPDAFVVVSGTIVSISFDGSGMLSEVTDERLFHILQLTRSIAPVLIFPFFVILSIFAFYKNVLRRPLHVLNEGINKISRQELDFKLPYDFNSEFGGLCKAFESMRAQLVTSFNDLWESEENQRSIYRAFAHDLRTPLTVIKGSSDNILYIAAKNRDWNIVSQSVELTNQAVKRIELYAEQLKNLENTNSLQSVPKEIDLHEIYQTVQQQAAILSKQTNVDIDVTCQPDQKILVDAGIVLRVLDNILDNAIQYAKSEIHIDIKLEKKLLVVSVSDNGTGFQGDVLEKAAAPFYSTRKTEGHAGIGLTISRKLIECCNGHLEIYNLPGGGASVNFFIPV